MDSPVILIFITMPGGTEIILLLLIVLLLFGGRKIPQLMKGISQGIRELKKGKTGSNE